MSDQSIRKSNAKPDAMKFCAACNKQLSRKRYKGTLESNLAFSRRKYCGQECMADGMQKDIVTRDGYRKRARKHRKTKCEECGAIDELSINHKNRDWSDNRLENLETLCISCHMKKHWAEPDGLYPRKVLRCIVCDKVGKLVHSLCGKHWQRFKKYGDAHLTKTKQGVRIGDAQPLIRVDD